MKIAQGVRPSRGVYIPQFDQISVKISVLESDTLTVAPMGVKFGEQQGTFGSLLHAKFHPHRCNVSPLRGEKPQNRPDLGYVVSYYRLTT